MILRLLIRVGLLIRFFVIELCLSERVRLLGLSCSVLSGGWVWILEDEAGDQGRASFR